MIVLMLAAALAAPEPPPADAAASLAELQRVYQQSCAERAYGSYNDMCDQMRKQIRAYGRTLAAELRRPAPATQPPAPGALPEPAPALAPNPATPTRLVGSPSNPPG